MTFFLYLGWFLFSIEVGWQDSSSCLGGFVEGGFPLGSSSYPSQSSNFMDWEEFPCSIVQRIGHVQLVRVGQNSFHLDIVVSLIVLLLVHGRSNMGLMRETQHMMVSLHMMSTQFSSQIVWGMTNVRWGEEVPWMVVCSSQGNQVGISHALLGHMQVWLPLKRVSTNGI